MGLRMSKIVHDAHVMREELNGKFVRSHVPLVAIVALVCLCDLTMVQFLPWRQGLYNIASKGFPTMGLLRFALGTKVAQAIVSVVCQLTFLTVDSGDLKGPTSSPQAKALFSMSIAFSILGLIMGILLLMVQRRFLKTADVLRDSEAIRAEPEEISHPGTGGAVDLGVEMHSVYTDVENVCTDTDNPLHASLETDNMDDI